jgi:hypothetical protein
MRSHAHQKVKAHLPDSATRLSLKTEPTSRRSFSNPPVQVKLIAGLTLIGLCGDRLLVFFQDIECIAMVKLHAYSTKDCAHGSSGTALFANDLTDILWSDAQTENGIFVPGYGVNHDRTGFIYKGPGNLCY